MRKIDIHAHAFPPSYVNALGKNIDGNQPIRSSWVWDEDRYLGEMDRWGIQVQVLSLAHAYTNFDNIPLGIELCRMVNDEYAKICSRRPDRFRMFALIPLIDVEKACKELKRVKGLPGYSGIALSTHICGRVLDEPSFEDFFEYANASDTVIFLHPLGRKLPKEWTGYRLEHLIGLPVETTFALSRLALSGFLDKYPNLKIIAAHVGGTLPYLSPRIERAYKEGAAAHKPSYYFRRFYYDTSGPTHEDILVCVSRMFGSEQILFGTDYPFGIGQEGMQYIEHAIWTVENSMLSEADKNRIFYENVTALLDAGV
jgi:predicted TIM-barrel fold metal-dependent hydrolase